MTTTAFQERVFAALREIPSGSVTTYKLLGQHLGCRSARAIGQALRQNPYAPEVPCHRVIRTDLSIGGYAGASKGRLVEKKKRLLASEGVLFSNGRLAEPGRIFTFGMQKT